MKEMRAVVLTANQKMNLQKIPLPKLDDNSCRIKIKNVGVCSSDIARGFGGSAYFYPLIMGHEISGQIVEIGKKIKNFFINDAVVIFPLLPCFKCEACEREIYAQCHDYSYYGSRCNGAYAEYIDVKEWNLLKIPEGIEYVDAASVEPLGVVLHAIKRTNISNDKKIAIIGAGFLGLLMAQIIKLKFPECQVTIFDRNQFKLDIAKKYSKYSLLLKNQNDWDGYIKLEGEDEFDIVVEASGVAQNFVNAIKITAHGGSTLWMGNVNNDVEISKKTISSVLRKEMTIIGTWNSEYNPKKYDDWKEALDLIKQGVRPSQLVTHFISLEEIPQTLLKIYNHKEGKERFDSIKVMVKFQ